MSDRERSGPCVECGFHRQDEPKADAERRAIHEAHGVRDRGADPLREALEAADAAIMALGRTMFLEEAKAPDQRDTFAIGKSIAEALNTHIASKRALREEPQRR